MRLDTWLDVALEGGVTELQRGLGTYRELRALLEGEWKAHASAVAESTARAKDRCLEGLEEPVVWTMLGVVFVAVVACWARAVHWDWLGGHAPSRLQPAAFGIWTGGAASTLVVSLDAKPRALLRGGAADHLDGRGVGDASAVDLGEGRKLIRCSS